jgi:hypothetical protein
LIVGHRRHRFGRRAFAGGAAAAGFTLGLPWLERLSGEGRARAGGVPHRLVILSVGFGPHADVSGRPDWIPASPGPITAMPTLLEPLAAYRDRLTTVEGVDNIVRGEIAGDNHLTGSMAVLTCQPHQEAVSGTSITGAEVSFGASNAAGPSIDYAIADARGQTPLTLRVGQNQAQSRRHFGVDLLEAPGESDPNRAFDRLFAAHTMPATPTPRELLRRRRADLLGTLEGNYRAIAGRLGAADRAQFEAHAQLVHDFQARLDRTTTIVCTDPSIPSTAGITDFDSWNGEHDDVIVPTQNALIATAFACRAVDVATINMAAYDENLFPFLNGGRPFPFSTNWHGAIHGDGGYEERLPPIRWHFEMMADLVARLDAIPEGDGTVLDNTIVLWTSSLSNQFHGHDDMPIIAVSGANSGLVKGHLDLSRSRRTLADFYVTLMNLMDVPATEFGWNHGVSSDGRAFNNGPIAELMA